MSEAAETSGVEESRRGGSFGRLRNVATRLQATDASQAVRPDRRALRVKSGNVRRSCCRRAKQGRSHTAHEDPEHVGDDMRRLLGGDSEGRGSRRRAAAIGLGLLLLLVGLVWFTSLRVGDARGGEDALLGDLQRLAPFGEFGDLGETDAERPPARRSRRRAPAPRRTVPRPPPAEGKRRLLAAVGAPRALVDRIAPAPRPTGGSRRRSGRRRTVSFATPRPRSSSTPVRRPPPSRRRRTASSTPSPRTPAPSTPRKETASTTPKQGTGPGTGPSPAGSAPGSGSAPGGSSQGGTGTTTGDPTPSGSQSETAPADGSQPAAGGSSPPAASGGSQTGSQEPAP